MLTLYTLIVVLRHRAQRELCPWALSVMTRHHRLLPARDDDPGAAVAFGPLAWRWDLLRADGELDSVPSRESAFLHNNLFLVAAAFTVFSGTVFPLLSEAIRGVKVSVVVIVHPRRRRAAHRRRAAGAGCARPRAHGVHRRYHRPRRLPRRPRPHAHGRRIRRHRVRLDHPVHAFGVRPEGEWGKSLRRRRLRLCG